LLGKLLVGHLDLAGVFLQAVEQHDEVAGALVQKAVSGVGKSNP
jgi:hypothetical protein